MKRYTVGFACLCALLVLAGTIQARNVLPPQTEICMQIDGFCDVINMVVDNETGLIEGVNNNCDVGSSILVGGQFFNYTLVPDIQQPWIMFFDYKPGIRDDVNGDHFEYAVIMGQGDKGLLQRYWSDGTPYEGDVTEITVLMGCDDLTRGLPTSRIE